MDQTFDIVLTAASIVTGILLLTGHGEIFMKGGNADVRKKLYDEEKMAKASGAALLLTGIATGANSLTEGLAASLIYIAALIVIFGGLIFYIRKYCRK